MMPGPNPVTVPPSCSMTPPSDDPLSREIEAALEGVELQSIGRTPDEGNQGPRSGAPDLWKGTVVGVSGDDVIVELSPTMQGVLSKNEFDEPPATGQVFEFSLRGQEDGLWILSRREARQMAAWNDIQVGSRAEARVTGVNKGGLELKLGPVSAFMPASHVALGRVEDLTTCIDQVFECEVLEVDRERKRVLLSRRAVLAAEREAARVETVGSLSSGQIVDGKVTRIEAFGAFVDIGAGIEGLLHVSNMSRKRVEDPKEFVSVGQELQVKILEIKEGGKRIGLGLKQLEADPWAEVYETLREDQVVQGKVSRMMDFGAFVELLPGVDGLLHVSQMAKDRVRRPQDAVSVGQEVTVRIQSIDGAQRRISLSCLDERGAVIGSEEAVDGQVLREALDKAGGAPAQTNLGSLFKKAFEPDADA